ncbi:metallophosphoesterase [Persicimonas caeni]|uniref:Metallophosphoesterase n=1 Tax=Persicimonas caeni TaxID=2292766 RepID=A0A4Y6Q2N0_PERCE|nr:metallophosphoesterase [Persicimonas caeni]QED36060.1 metallophosphoesterase [Persicimonas caeni]
MSLLLAPVIGAGAVSTLFEVVRCRPCSDALCKGRVVKQFFKYAGVGLLIFLGFVLAWGLIEPRYLAVENEEVAIVDLPRAWDGQRVAQLSDWQIGMWLDNPDTAEDAAEVIIEERPAAVMLTGDFVYHRGDEEDRVEQFGKVSEVLRPLVDSGIPTYAVLGNHDYAAEKPDSKLDRELARTVTRTLRRAGVTVLFNEAVPLRPPTNAPANGPDELLYLVGVGSHYAKNDDVEGALDDLPRGAPRIAMMHNPDSYARFPARTAPLAVAGHTHGGQIRLPWLPDFSYQTFAKDGDVHVDGWVEDFGEEGNRLYVNRGIGMSLLPIRVNCMPELTMFTLRRAEGEAEPMAVGR